MDESGAKSGQGEVAVPSSPTADSEEYRSQIRLALKALGRDRLALVGVVVVLVVVILAIMAPLISPWEPTEADFDTGRFAPIGSPGHLLGTDGQARDILSRLLWGSRVSVPVAVVPVLFSVIAGLVFGLTAGMSGRWVAEIIMRMQDVLFAFRPYCWPLPWRR